ncbi:MAG TPA: alpha/beta hydrolase [Oscillospiraceae bacterium]|nr:alpha/beta hydrolase [Oscillospiraceae bacterium]
MAVKSVFKSAAGKNAVLAVYDSLLGQWPVPYDTIQVETRHGGAFVIAGGADALPPLVLLHGSSSNSAMWIGDFAAYAKDHRVYAVDLPGEPGKSTDIRPDLRTAAYAEWMKDVLDALGAGKASFVGISLGGWLALRFATAYPERVASLALLCPAGLGPQKASILLYAMLLKPFGKWGAAKAFRKIMGTAEIAEEAVAYGKLIAKHFSPYTGTVPLLSEEELQRLTCPTLLVVGGRDVLIDSRRTVEKAKRGLPHAQIVLLPDAGHGLINQTERIVPFLSKYAPAQKTACPNAQEK